MIVSHDGIIFCCMFCTALSTNDFISDRWCMLDISKFISRLNPVLKGNRDVRSFHFSLFLFV